MRVAGFKVCVRVSESQSSLTSWIQKEFFRGVLCDYAFARFLMLCGTTHYYLN